MIDWAGLEPGARAVLEQQWLGLAAGGLPCGAAVTDASGSIVATGRNHVYDDPSGSEPLERTRIAHAEINALAKTDTTIDHSRLTLWSSQHPCAMCAAVADFTGLGEVVYLADDPSDFRSVDQVAASRGSVSYRAFGEPDWWVASNLLFLAVAARREGGRARNVVSNAARYPDLIRLTMDVAASASLTGPAAAGATLFDALAPLAEAIDEVASDMSKGASSTFQDGRLPDQWCRTTH